MRKIRLTNNRNEGLEGLKIQAEDDDGNKLIVRISREAIEDHTLGACELKAIDKYIAGQVNSDASVTVTTADFARTRR